ncbi:YmaF family protein [Melghirimyces profundicolus]|uniref:YmaF family protein n=1 Tax=Melghirimyces profundicolus TaxID=1242148 RepID=UPI001FE3A153|nr:YmaF family protein [Melghirimyces profundicolus]
MAGITAPAANLDHHVHEYRGTTTFDDGHVHHFHGITGPPIPLPNGSHYHEIQGTTTTAGDTPHTHHYKGVAR